MFLIHLKSNSMRSIPHLLRGVGVSLLVISAFSTTSAAQIQIDSLNPASAYDGGILDQTQGGLDSSLWQNTTATRATTLIESFTTPASPESHALFRSALLSGGVPPRAADAAERAAYVTARLSVLLAQGDVAGFDQLAQGASVVEGDPAYDELFADRALLAGHIDRACQITDSLTSKRAQAYWAKLRAYCHFIRGEIPAAELTSDLLRRASDPDTHFFNLLGSLTGSRIKKPDLGQLDTPLNVAMARDYMRAHADQKFAMDKIPAVLAAEIANSGEFDPDIRLAALRTSAQILKPGQMHQILSGFGATPLDNFEDLKKLRSWTAPVWGQAYGALKSSTDIGSNTVIVAEMLRRAEAAGMLGPIADVLSDDLRIIPASLKAAENPELFARISVQNRDLTALGELYRALTDDKPLKTRIALASDALGGGFTLAELGTDIETRLASQGSEKSRAVRDAYIAVALGSTLSDNAIALLSENRVSAGTPLSSGAVLALQETARRGAKAETALRAAHLIGNTPINGLRDQDLASILFAFNQAGLFELSGYLAAQDFLSGTP